MTVDVIQPTLQQIVRSTLQIIAAPITEAVIIDDGQQEPVMERFLQSIGIVIDIMPPQSSSILEQGRFNALLSYTTTVWIRTNPKITSPKSPAWNPLVFEKLIIPAVFGWNLGGNQGQQPFQITPGMEPETDYMDSGNNSRLIRFSTKIHYNDKSSS